MLAELACLSLHTGRLGEAETNARASLEIADALRDRAGRVLGVGVLACLAAERGLAEGRELTLDEAGEAALGDAG